MACPKREDRIFDAERSMSWMCVGILARTIGITMPKGFVADLFEYKISSENWKNAIVYGIRKKR